MERRFLKSLKMVDHFFDSPLIGLPVGFPFSGINFEFELLHLQRWRESSVFAFPSVFPMISRQILRGAEVAGFSVGEHFLTETHVKKMTFDRQILLVWIPLRNFILLCWPN